MRADRMRADRVMADLTMADLTMADLTVADLTMADLMMADHVGILAEVLTLHTSQCLLMSIRPCVRMDLRSLRLCDPQCGANNLVRLAMDVSGLATRRLARRLC
jgi:hypothetical protein